MFIGDTFLFTLHQYTISVFCLFLLYFAWKDQFTKNYDRLSENPLIRIAPIFIGLFLGLFLLFLSEWWRFSIVLPFAFALLISLSIFDPKYAVSFFVFLLISRPWEILKDQMLESMPRDIFILCFLSFVGHKIIRKRFYFQWNKASACVLLFAVWTFFSIIPSYQMSSALVNYDEVFIKGIIVYFLIVNVIDKKDFIYPVQSALVLGITEKSIISFYNTFVLGRMAEGGRLVSVGVFENSNDIAAIMILVLPFTFVFLKGIYYRSVQCFLGLLIAVFYSCLIWQSKSRGAIIGLATLAISYLWLNSKSKKTASLLVVFGIVLSLGGISLIERNAEDVEGSSTNRKIYWNAALNMGIKNPLFGVGYDGFPRNLLSYTDGHVGTEGNHKTAHSTWLLALAETGIIGFVFYFGIWFYSFTTAWQIRAEFPEFLLAILSYGVTISFLSHTYLLYPYILLGLTVASGKFNCSKVEINNHVPLKINKADNLC